MPGGIGTSPFGTGPYGYGSAPAAPAAAPATFTGTNSLSSQPYTGRMISPETQQYVFDSFGRIAGQDTVPQLVYLAYATIRGSSVLTSLGSQIAGTQTISDDFQDVITRIALEPIQGLIDQKLMTVNTVTVTRIGTDGVLIKVLWKDLTTGLQQVTRI